MAVGLKGGGFSGWAGEQRQKKVQAYEERGGNQSIWGVWRKEASNNNGRGRRNEIRHQS